MTDDQMREQEDPIKSAAALAIGAAIGFGIELLLFWVIVWALR